MTDVKVGDIFECSWGYDQTNVDFYEVVGLTPSGKSVKVRRTAKKRTDDSHVTAAPGACSDTPTTTKRISIGYQGRPSFRVSSYADAYLWDGKPTYETPSGMGH